MFHGVIKKNKSGTVFLRHDVVDLAQMFFFYSLVR